jgi:hypothetical protein
VALLFIYTLILLSQLDNKAYPTVPHVLSWLLGAFFEIAILTCNLLVWTREAPTQEQSSWNIITLTIDVVRIMFLLGMTGLYVVLIIFATRNKHNDDETTGLLAAANRDYGSATQQAAKKSGEEQQAAWARRNLIGQRQNWWEYLRGYTVSTFINSHRSSVNILGLLSISLAFKEHKVTDSDDNMLYLDVVTESCQCACTRSTWQGHELAGTES